MDTHYDVLIVGAGKAGSQLATSLRDEGFAGSICLVGKEPTSPYDRPPLSKEYLYGSMTLDSLYTRPEGHYEAANITLLNALTAVALDTTARHVRLDDGRTLEYGDLVIATGAVPRALTIPGADLGGVMGLRSLEDATRLAQALAEGDGPVVIIGGGFIGLEVAVAAAERFGRRVTLIEFLPRLMMRTALPETAEAARRHLADIGVDVVLGVGVDQLRGHDGTVRSVITSAGEFDADVVVYGVGVVPSVELAVAGGLAVDGGIVVDESMRTSAPNVWAIGDCCVFPSQHAGGPLRLESVQNATDQARHLAAQLAGGDAAAYLSLPWFWSDQGSLKIQSAGIMITKDETVVVGDADGDSFSVLAFSNGVLIGGDSVNAPGDHLALRRLLAGRAGTPVLTPAIATAPGFDLKGFSKGMSGTRV